MAVRALISRFAIPVTLAGNICFLAGWILRERSLVGGAWVIFGIGIGGFLAAPVDLGVRAPSLMRTGIAICCAASVADGVLILLRAPAGAVYVATTILAIGTASAFWGRRREPRSS